MKENSKTMPVPGAGNEESQDQQSRPDRLTEYTREIAEEICDRLVEGESLRCICADPRMPDVATVASWIANNAEFRESYALAREFQAYDILDEVLALADQIGPSWVEKVRANGRVVQARDRKDLPRCRLRCEARHLVADAFFARARQLSARRLFPSLAPPEPRNPSGTSR
jgi:hypothetical protein